jgi:hypothetical protein
VAGDILQAILIPDGQGYLINTGFIIGIVCGHAFGRTAVIKIPVEANNVSLRETSVEFEQLADKALVRPIDDRLGWWTGCRLLRPVRLVNRDLDRVGIVAAFVGYG